MLPVNDDDPDNWPDEDDDDGEDYAGCGIPGCDCASYNYEDYESDEDDDE